MICNYKGADVLNTSQRHNPITILSNFKQQSRKGESIQPANGLPSANYKGCPIKIQPVPVHKANLT